jgi:thiamine biosynthesis lipoprotein ApbE
VKLGARAPDKLTEIQQGIEARIQDVARHVSRWDDTSELSALNASMRSD